MRRAMAWLASMLTAVLLCGAAFAQGSYPDHKIRMIVPFSAGGPTDVIGRLVAERLSEVLGQQVYVENLPGAGGNLGVETAKRAAPDGYTILVVSTGFIINPSMYTTIGYDPLKDFAPISLVAVSPNVITVHPSLPAKNLKELIDLIKANPDKIQLRAAGSTGSTPHLVAELMKQIFGARHGDGAVQRRAARHQFHLGQPHADGVHGAAAGDRRRQGRQPARHRDPGQTARRGAAGSADQRRGRRAGSRRATR